MSEPNNEEVICPHCAYQFRAIPVQVQGLLTAAGYEPPYLAAPTPQGVALTDEQIDALLRAIDDIARKHDHYDYGLPLGFDRSDDYGPAITSHAEMRAAVRAALPTSGEPAETQAAPQHAPTLPPEIVAIAARLHTQDNRITDNPLFAVQQKRVIGGLDDDYADSFAWISDGCEVDAEESARLDGLRRAGEPLPDDVRRVGYIERWEFVTGCLTEQGCKDYIACNGHNLKEPRIFAYGSYRNAEFIALRKWLMSLDRAGEKKV
jgi:hypothetical protein